MRNLPNDVAPRRFHFFERTGARWVVLRFRSEAETLASRRRAVKETGWEMMKCDAVLN